MRWARYAIIILVVMLIQASDVLDLISVTQLNIKPNLLVVLLVFFAVNCDPFEAIMLSFATGFAADVINLPMGQEIIAFGVLGGLLVYVRDLVLIKPMLRQSIVIFAVSVLAGLLSSFLARLKGSAGPEGSYAAILGCAAYSALVGPYIMSVFLVLVRWLKIARRPRFGRAGRNR